MKRIITLILTAVLAIGLAAGLTACGQSNADVAAHNISVEAEQFKVPRRILAINGITDKVLLEITGYCSVETSNSALSGALEITCRVITPLGKKYFKEFVGLSDNVSYTVDQLQPINVSTSRYEVIVKPSTLIPDIRLK
jgi:hypothetical protein